jgi:hypothetical protein
VNSTTSNVLVYWIAQLLIKLPEMAGCDTERSAVSAERVRQAIESEPVAHEPVAILEIGTATSWNINGVQPRSR